MAAPILELRGINKSFGPIDVLHDISLQVSAGEVLSAVGDTGLDGRSGVYLEIRNGKQPVDPEFHGASGAASVSAKQSG